MKVCAKCGESKPLSDFHRRAQSPDKRQAYCMECKHAVARECYKQRTKQMEARRKKLWGDDVRGS